MPTASIVRLFYLSLLVVSSLVAFHVAPVQAEESSTAFRAGAAAVDVTPTKFPVIVNGMFEERTANSAADPVFARAIVLEEGRTRIAIVVVDSCMMPRDLLDSAKATAGQATGIPSDHILISATHTHSAPSAMGALGSDADPEYIKFLPGKIAEAIAAAAKNLVPARVGSASIDAPEYTHCRRWIWRPDRIGRDPFGELTVRANMHPGYQNPGAVGPSGPVDSGLSVLSIQSMDGKPIAVLANYAMHYFGSPMVSADYYGLFCGKLATALGAGKNERPFVAMMSQGTSGDQWWGDYANPQKSPTMPAYTDAIVALAKRAYDGIAYADHPAIAMKESKLTLHRRIADEKRLAWARETVAKLNGRKPTALPDVYAREQIFISEAPVRELKLQAIRIGDLGIVAIPDEVFGITGLKIKARSPLPRTFVMELANGSEGYIPPPEQHKLGGYTTWAARTAGLETEAEPKIVESVLGLLEDISGTPRRKDSDVRGAYAQAMQASKPLAWWPMGEFSGPSALDASGNDHPATYEDGVVFYLDGPKFTKSNGEAARAAHFAGGRLRAGLKQVGKTWSAELWFWNALAGEARPVSAYLLSRGSDGSKDAPGDHLGIGGTFAAQGKLIFFNGNRLDQMLSGATEIQPRTWNHVAVVREGKKLNVYLNGNKDTEISGEIESGLPDGGGEFYIGGRSDNFANLEGKACEAAIYDRALSAEEIAAHYAASGLAARPLRHANKPTPPRSPEEALRTLHVRDGFEVELVAAEPLVKDPVAIAWGADGKLWVVEMADYPTGMDGHMKPGGRVRFLESTHNDGHYDKSTLFLDDINFPTGILPWRKGVIITAAPEIFYAEDTHGDGKADVRKTLYRGFKEGNTQLRVNGLRWGIDGWIYCANGWSGGIVRSEKTGQSVDLSGHDFRIKPDEGLIELQSGMSEFGRDCDDWGNWFGCDNSNPLFHFPIDDRYLRRNQHIIPPDGKIQLITPTNPRVYALSQPQKRYHSFEHSDHFTSACSGMVYRGSLLFPSEEGIEHGFVCEPVHNMVHHEVLREAGVSFTASRSPEEKESEFLATDDQWFRPVMVRTGPDGALWVVDMYRYVIEHPDWLPPQGKAELSAYWRLGDDKGRIYRIYPKGRKPPATPRLDQLSAEQLASLDNAGAWERDVRQQLLLWKNDAAAVPRLSASLQSSFVHSRMTALCTLDLLGALTSENVEKVLRDAHPAIRRQAVRLAEPRAKDSPRLIDAAVNLVDDPDAKVRLQLACTLGEWNDPRAGEALARLAVKDADDPYISGAVMTSALPHYETIARALLGSGRPIPSRLSQNLLGITLGVGNREVMARLLHSINSSGNGRYTAAQFEAFRGWLDALWQRGKSLKDLATSDNDALSMELSRASTMFEAARVVVVNAARPADDRTAAAGLLGREEGKQADDLPRLAALLTPQSPGGLQLAAVRAMGKSGQDRVPALLVDGWIDHSPDVRRAAVDLLMGREPWTMEFLAAIESGKISPRELDLPHRQRLLENASPHVKELAARLLGNAVDPVRQKVLDAYQPALSLTGDGRHGALVFAQNCATCHRLGDVGQEIGPNLKSVSGWTSEALLTAILDPSRQVEPRYLSFTATLNDGEAVFGIITSESAGSITMKGLDGKERPLLRSSIKTLAGSNRSLMPDGLESALSKQDVADVIHFLQTQ